MEAVHKSFLFVRLAIFVASLFAALPGLAQTPSPLMDWQYSTGDAARSPIAETKNQIAADINIGYRF